MINRASDVPEPTPAAAPEFGRARTGTTDGAGAGGAERAEVPSFQPRVESFAGPLDLLLYLIHKNEVDIFDIPIAEILEQYLAHVKILERHRLIDLGEAGAFLVMASRLMEIKSRMLLPELAAAEDEGLLEEEIVDPRLSLVEQLLEYKEIKERAVMLERVHEEWASRYERPLAELPPPPPDTLDLSAINVWDLCAAFQRVLADARTEAVAVIEIDDTPIEEIIASIQRRLEENASGTLSFDAVFRPALGRAGLISHFLALLEMARLHLIWITQESDLGEILVTRRILP
ncbi:MAG: segregation/condensation protein A [Planctomycetes bacterium]|nr:segregation/condensation protein A [Planctomycetota bacterium]